MKFLLIFLALFLAACGQQSTSTVDYRAALNPETHTLSLSGMSVPEITSIASSITERNDQLRVNHFIASNAGVTKVDPNAFLFLSNLSVLDLTNNTLQKIALAPSGVIDLHLSHNNISQVDLSELEKGHNIWLDYNNISDLSQVHLPKDVLNLSLADNNVSDVSSLEKYALLRVLDLSNNSLNAGDIEALKKIPRLAQVNLEGNNISKEEIQLLQDWLDKRSSQG